MSPFQDFIFGKMTDGAKSQECGGFPTMFWPNTALLIILCEKVHCHDVKSICLVQDLVSLFKCNCFGGAKS
jgi:hypothetical protein